VPNKIKGNDKTGAPHQSLVRQTWKYDTAKMEGLRSMSDYPLPGMDSFVVAEMRPMSRWLAGNGMKKLRRKSWEWHTTDGINKRREKRGLWRSATVANRAFPGQIFLFKLNAKPANAGKRRRSTKPRFLYGTSHIGNLVKEIDWVSGNMRLKNLGEKY
jgi:hypothetical protein